MENETVSSNPVPTQVSLDNKKDIPHERIILLILVFFTLCFVAGIFFLKRSTTQSQQSTSSQVLSPTPSSIASSSAVIQQNQDPFDVPPLYPSLSWTPVATGSGIEKLLEGRELFLQGKEIKYATVSGSQWMAEKENLSLADLNSLVSDFRGYYGSELKKRGWNESLRTDGYSIMPIVADGPGGGTYGYVITNSRKFRSIIFQELLPVESFGGNPKCPCSASFYVFLSDVVPLETILSSPK